MESIGDARSFLSAAREVSLAKPIIVLKAGRTEQAARAAGSHTGSLAGSDEVLEAAFRRCGALRVTEIGDLFSMAEVLARQPRPRGMRLTIVTNAGGPGVLATDALITGSGQLATLSPDTVAALDANLPAHWSHNNPVDVLGDAGPERYAQTLKTVVADPDSDGLLVILTPQDMTDPTETAKALAPYAKAGDKPVLASWMGGKLTEAGELILNQAGVPTFPYPDTAARAFNYMWRYSDNLRGLYETPALPQGADHQSDRAAAQRIISATMAQKRTILTETESKALLAAYGLPTVSTHLAETADEAVRHAERIGYPVVLKLFSETITHKTDVGGVQLNLANADAVRKAFEQIRDSVSQKAGPGHFGGTTVQQMVRLPDAYELIIGSTVDAQLGPVLLFGAGGQLVEVFRDRALALPPLTATLARRTMERTRILEALKGIRGRRPIDIAALEQLLVRFSTLVVEQPRIREIDINPLLASPEQMIALDARILLHDASIGDEQLPRPAIRPYPSQYAGTATLRDGSAVAIRPIRPEDEPLVIQFHASLSERSVRFRYFHQMKLEQRVAHERLIRICFNDYDRDLALVALRDQQILGIGRLNKNSGTQDAEFSLVIADGMQHKGLGTELLSRLIQIARDEKLTRISGTILPENGDMQRLCAKLGFRLTEDADENVVRAEMPLDSK
jgi:acetyltransferase